MKISHPDQLLGKAPFQPVAAFGGMLALWCLVFPFVFVNRRRMGARNFLIPAIIVDIAFMVASVAAALSESTVS